MQRLVYAAFRASGCANPPNICRGVNGGDRGDDTEAAATELLRKGAKNGAGEAAERGLSRALAAMRACRLAMTGN